MNVNTFVRGNERWFITFELMLWLTQRGVFGKKRKSQTVYINTDSRLG